MGLSGRISWVGGWAPSLLGYAIRLCVLMRLAACLRKNRFYFPWISVACLTLFLLNMSASRLSGMTSDLRLSHGTRQIFGSRPNPPCCSLDARVFPSSHRCLVPRACFRYAKTCLIFLKIVEGTLQFVVCRYTVTLSRVVQDCVRSEVPRPQLEGPVVAMGQVARGPETCGST